MSKNILWLDNDSRYIGVYVKTLKGEAEPSEVTIVSTITEAEECLRRERYDLLILDVMVPTTNDQEEERYPPDQTDHGLKTGLSFYEGHKKYLAENGTKVLVLTARIDASIKQQFLEAGLNTDSIVEKAEVAEVTDFLKIVQALLGG